MNFIQLMVKTMALATILSVASIQAAPPADSHLLDHDARRLGSDELVNLRDAYGGKVVLVVNTASKCAFTGQYEGLEELYAKYRDRGLVVLGFPSNDFGGQEPGSEKEIQDFCRLTYSVKFPMFAKTPVKKGVANPFFQGLADAAGRYPKWNFHKYLIDRDGQMVDNYLSVTSPSSKTLIRAIERLL